MDCTRKSVSIIRFLIGRRRVESAVVSLPADDDGDLWSIPPLYFLKRWQHSLEKLVFEYMFLILSLRFCLSNLSDLRGLKELTSLTPSLYIISRLGRVLLAALYACSLSIIVSVRHSISLEKG